MVEYPGPHYDPIRRDLRGLWGGLWALRGLSGAGGCPGYPLIITLTAGDVTVFLIAIGALADQDKLSP